MKNAYKRLNIFKCVHEAHKGFESQMSVHHILNRKACFPHGCFYFKTSCKLMKQGKKCYRGYNYMGRNCVGCRHFNEEKIHNHPELQIPDKEYQDFLMELRVFEDWVQDHVNREQEIHGRIDGIKPLFRKRLYEKGEAFTFSGFLVIFRNLFIGKINMEDHVYIRLSPKTYASLKFGKGDVLTARGTMTLDQGRIVFKKLRRIEIEERGEAPIWNESRALVARETATEFSIQPEGCIHCPYGALVDVEDMKRSNTRNYRRLHCLKGCTDYRACPIYYRYANSDQTVTPQSTNAASCMTRKVSVAS